MKRLLDLVRGLIGLAGGLAILVGVPSILVVLVGWPFPAETPEWAVVERHLLDGNVPAPFLLKALAVFAWFIWAQLVVALVAEVMAVIQGRLANRAPVLPGLQMVAAKMVASALLFLSAFSPPRGAAAVPLESMAEVVTDQVGSVSALTSWTAPGPTDGANVVVEDDAIVEVLGQQIRTGDQVYVVEDGDSWWEVAERLTGDGLRWREMRDLNVGRQVAPGAVVENQTEELGVGWRLLVPDDADRSLLVDAGPGDASEVAAVSSDAVSQGSSASIEVEVEVGDTLWAIADEELGDPLRWTEIYEQSHGMPQPNGRVIENPDVIWPGDTVVVPGDSSMAPEDPDVVPGDGAVVPGDGAVVPGGNEIAPPQTPDGEEDSTPKTVAEVAVAADGSDVPDNTVPSAPSAPIEPPRDAVVPPVPVPLPDDEQAAVPDGEQAPVPDGAQGPASTPTIVSKPALEGQPEAPGDQDQSSESDDGQAADGVALVTSLALGSGAMLVGAGSLGLLRGLRRLRRSNLGAGTVPAPPPLELVEVETVLRGQVDERGLAQLQHIARSAAMLPTPEFFRLHEARAEVVVDESSDGWSGGSEPWVPIPVVDGSALPNGRRALALLGDSFANVADPAGPEKSGQQPAGPEQTAAAATPLPTLVTIGRNLFANLETLGVVAIEGSTENVAGLVRSMVLELATGPLEPDRRRAPQVRVSFALPGTDLHPNVRCGPVGRIEAELGNWIEQVELSLTAAGSASSWALRARSSDSLPPPVVLVLGEADLEKDPALAAFVERARVRRLPLTVVLVADPDRRLVEPNVSLVVTDDDVTVQPHGLVAGRHGLHEDVVVGIESLIDHARRAPLMPRPEPAWSDPVDLDPSNFGPVGLSAWASNLPSAADEQPPAQVDIDTVMPSAAVDATDQSAEVDQGLLIRVLGPVELEGGQVTAADAANDIEGSGSLPSSQAVVAAEEVETSMLTYLALSGPSTIDRLAEAVWPNDPHAEDRAEQTLAQLARRHGQLLTVSEDRRYRLRSTATDLGTARRLVEQAQRVEPERAMNLLHTALADVRGRPFEGVDPRYWQWLEDHRGAIATQATSILVDACFELCDLAWEANDPGLAGWACEVAARIEPLQETVATRRAQILVGAGRLSEATAVVEEWETSFSQISGRSAPHGPRSVLPVAAGAGAMATMGE